MNFDIKDLKSWANRNDVVELSVAGFFGNSLLEIDNEIRRYNKGEKDHLHMLYQISDNGCCCFGYATYFTDTGAFSGTNNFAFFLPLDAVKKEIKMNFDIKDVKSWSNRYDVKIGDEGYFFYDIDKLRNFENECIKPVKSKLSAIRDNYAPCFQIDNGHDGYNVFPFFLPLDAVKNDKSKKKYRPFKDAYEIYKFLVNPSFKRKVFSDKLLLNLPITWRKKDTSNFTTTELITSVEDSVIDGCQLTSINNKELEYWFNNYEIEINGEWQPFGAVEDCTGAVEDCVGQ